MNAVWNSNLNEILRTKKSVAADKDDASRGAVTLDRGK
jgi:hypothetical protein